METAIVLPVLILLLLGFFQFSSMFFTRHGMLHAAREGVRTLAVQDATVAQAEQRTRDVLASLGFRPDEFQIMGDDSIADASITVAIPAAQASIIGDPVGWMGTSNLTAAAVMRNESG